MAQLKSFVSQKSKPILPTTLLPPPSHPLFILRKHLNISKNVYLPYLYILYEMLHFVSIQVCSEAPEMFYKKNVLKNFAKFTGKHLCQSLLLFKARVLLWNLQDFYTCLQNTSVRLLLSVKNSVRWKRRYY